MGQASGNGGNLNLDQRSFVTRPSVSDPHRRAGKVVIDIQVDKNGNSYLCPVWARYYNDGFRPYRKMRGSR